MTPYTVADTPAVVQRIDADLAQVVATVRSGDASLRSLILTGGFARGEGSVLEGQPQNDYDFVAVRGGGAPRVAYARMREELERRLGLHVDLAPVAAWRLPWAAPTVFWYETALRGRLLWGEDLRPRIRVRDPDALDEKEALRLLVNRAAGLLLATHRSHPHELRLQAAKALLAVLDAHLFALGPFAPSQAERWRQFNLLERIGKAPAALVAQRDWIAWAYAFKVAPGLAPARDAGEAWRAARRAVLDAVPVALRRAGLPSREAYGRSDGLLDRLIYLRRAGQVPGARRLARHPTGRVRLATLRMLESAWNGHLMPHDAARCLRGLAKAGPEPLQTFAGLRAATLQ